MKRVVAVLLLAALICTAFSGCGGTPFRPVEALMRPPSYSDSKKGIISEFNNAVGAGTSFCPPISGDYNSAIVVENLGNENSQQAFVFYKSKNSPGSVRMNFLDYRSEKWVSLADLNGYGTGVESISFEDLDFDGMREAIVCWKTGMSTGKVLSVYCFDESGLKFREVSNEAYSIMTCVDIDGDGKIEMLTVNQSTVNGVVQCTASVFKLLEGEMALLNSIKLDGSISGYVSLTSEKRNEKSPLLIFIDALKGENQMITEVLFWDQSLVSLVDPFVDPDTLMNTATLRYEPIPCMDIDNDGSINIPVQNAFVSAAEAAESTEIIGSTPGSIPEADTASKVQKTTYITTWFTVEGSVLAPAFHSLVDAQHGFMFLAEDSEFGVISAYRKEKDQIVFTIPGEKKEDGTKEEPTGLFMLEAIEKGSKQAEKNENPVLFSNEDYLISAVIYPEGIARGYTAEALKNRITEYKQLNGK